MCNSPSYLDECECAKPFNATQVRHQLLQTACPVHSAPRSVWHSVRESWHTKSHELFTIIHITWHENTVNSFWIPKILDRPALQVLALPRTSRWLGQRHDIAHFLPSIWHHSHFCPRTQTCCTRWPSVCKLAVVTLRLATLLLDPCIVVVSHLVSLGGTRNLGHHAQQQHAPGRVFTNKEQRAWKHALPHLSV